MIGIDRSQKGSCFLHEGFACRISFKDFLVVNFKTETSGLRIIITK